MWSSTRMRCLGGFWRLLGFGLPGGRCCIWLCLSTLRIFALTQGSASPVISDSPLGIIFPTASPPAGIASHWVLFSFLFLLLGPWKLVTLRLRDKSGDTLPTRKNTTEKKKKRPPLSRSIV
ncbi:hypothetical protein EDB80DRAFT_138284 [Ilyonectria destructans]|nr:hypothetical protein EDB80DRAFT_138284 [Ilyonectria destructans]